MKPQRPMIFISYSHEDIELAKRLSETLNDLGQEVWVDFWDLQPGDSIVQKIFEKGLAEASAFLILLSESSVSSKWVREELDHATVRRIEENTRVIPVLIDEVQVPAPLQTLLWVDLRSSFDEGVRAIVNAVTGASVRPPLGKVPTYLQDLRGSVGGLSPLATKLAAFLLKEIDPTESHLRSWRADQLSETIGLSPVELNDAVDELEEYGLVKKSKEFGSAPFDFMALTPTYVLFLHFAEHLDFQPDSDVQAVIAAIAAVGTARGDILVEHTGLPVGRLNRAVDYVADYGLADVVHFFGARPFTFGEVRATRRTRQAAAEGKA